MPTGTDDTRTLILNAARRLLGRHGPERVRMADVAAEAGLSRQAVYQHFGSRAGLMVALVEHVDRAEGIYERVAHVMAAPDGRELLDRVVRFQAEFNPRVWAVGEAISRARHTDPAAAAAWQNRLQGRLEGCRQIVARLQAEGLLAPVWPAQAAADLLWVLTSIDLWRDLVVERGWTASDYEDHLRRVLRSVFLT